jgi:hypothetical protein
MHRIVRQRTSDDTESFRMSATVFLAADFKLPVECARSRAIACCFNRQSETFETRFDLPSRYVLVANEEAQRYGTRAYQEKFGHSYGYVVLSKVGFNRDLTEAPFLHGTHLRPLWRWGVRLDQKGQWALGCGRGVIYMGVVNSGEHRDAPVHRHTT